MSNVKRLPLLVAFLILLLSLPASAQKAAVPRQIVKSVLKGMLTELKVLKYARRGPSTPDSQRQIRQSIRSLRTQIKSLLTILNNSGSCQTVPNQPGPPQPNQPQPPQPIQPQGPQPMSGPDFERALQTIKKESFDSSKLTVLGSIARNNHFTARQLTRIMRAFSFDGTKVKAVRICHTRVLDRGNLHLIYSAVTFSSNKQKIRKILEGR